MKDGEAVLLRMRDGNYRQVGKLVQDDAGNLWCRMYRERGKHFMRRLNAWGIDRNLLYHLSRQGVAGILLVVRDEGSAYRAPLVRILREGLRGNYGHGDQVFLEERHWDAVQSPQPAQLTFPLGVPG